MQESPFTQVKSELLPQVRKFLSNFNSDTPSQEKKKPKKVKKILTTGPMIMFSDIHRRKQIQNIFKLKKGFQQESEYVPLIIQYLYEKQLNSSLSHGIKLQEEQLKFVIGIQMVIKACFFFEIYNSICSACFFFYKLYTSDLYKHANNLDCLIVTSLLTSTKYNEIYPPFLSQFIKHINPPLKQDQVISCEGQLLFLIDFREYYTDNQLRWLDIFLAILNIEQNNQLVRKCKFLLSLGLFNQQLYTVKPSLKAVTVLTIVCKQIDVFESFSLDFCKRLIATSYDQIKSVQKLYKKQLCDKSKVKKTQCLEEQYCVSAESIKI